MNDKSNLCNNNNLNTVQSSKKESSDYHNEPFVLTDQDKDKDGENSDNDNCSRNEGRCIDLNRYNELVKCTKKNKPTISISSPRMSLKKIIQSQHSHSSPKKGSMRFSLMSFSNNITEGDKNDGMTFIDREIEFDEIEHIKAVIYNQFLFDHFPIEILNEILAELIILRIDEGRFIYQEGFEGNYFYIISKGIIELSIANKRNKKTIGEWESFVSFSTESKTNGAQGEGEGRTQNDSTSNNNNVISAKCISQAEVFIFEGNIYQMIQNEIDKIRLEEKFNFINKMEIFKSLESISRYNLALKISIIQFKPNEIIYTINDKDESIFLINKGSVKGTNDRNKTHFYKQNDVFGVNELLTLQHRNETTIANEHTVCLIVTQTNLKKALGADYRDVILYSLFKHAFESNASLNEIFPESKLISIYHSFALFTYSKNEQLHNIKLASNKKIVIIIEGTLVNANSHKPIGQRGEIIGAELINKPSFEISPDIITSQFTITLEATLDQIASVVGVKFQTRTLSLLKRINKLKDFHLFKHLPDNTLEIIAYTMTKNQYRDKSIIILEGTTGTTFYLIVKGKVEISHQGVYIRLLEKGSCFGEISLLHPELKRTATVIAVNEVICYELSKENFDIIVTDKKIRTYLKKRIALHKTSINLNDLFFISKMNKDNFGFTTYFVHNKDHLYSLKIIQKNIIKKDNALLKYISIEKDLLLQLDHPFIMKMVKTIEHPIYEIILNEFIGGKLLSEYLKEKTLIHNINDTRFLSANVLVIVNYLHRKMILHRNINPDTFMLEDTGCLKAISFGTAKIVSNYTKTIIGNPHYIAPEVIKGNGYSLSCDYWSIGVMVYEMFYGVCPFGLDKQNDTVELYKDILNKELVFPIQTKPFIPINTFIKSLLEKNVNLRKCSLGQLKNEEYFSNYNWDDILEFKIYYSNPNRKPSYVKTSFDDIQNIVKKHSIPFTDIVPLN